MLAPWTRYMVLCVSGVIPKRNVIASQKKKILIVHHSPEAKRGVDHGHMLRLGRKNPVRVAQKLIANGRIQGSTLGQALRRNNFWGALARRQGPNGKPLQASPSSPQPLSPLD